MRLGRWSLGVAAVLLCGLSNPSLADEQPQVIIGPAQVHDGDTFAIGPILIRLNGIDAPEAGQRCRTAAGRSWQCGTAATGRLADLTAGRDVTCTVRERDRYGRLISDCEAGGTNLSLAMVAEGHARAFRQFSDAFIKEEDAARASRLGIWAGESEAPWEYRADRWGRAVAEAPNGCPIKGNISSNGERIYHTPWSPNYSRTRIDEAAGERWFCDEAEAIASGWRGARSR